MCNLSVADYLDFTLNLKDGTYKPYRKPNNETMHIHEKSNHPPNIIKQIPLSIEGNTISRPAEGYSRKNGILRIPLNCC